MKYLRYVLGVVAFAVLGFVQTAQAVPMFFGFDVNFTLGPLAGQTAHGTAGVNSVQCGSGCNGTFTPSDPTKTLLGFNILVGGLNFAIFNDINFATGVFPDVTFTNNKISVFDYTGLLSGPSGDRQLNLSYAFGSGSAIFFDPNFVSTDPSFGQITAAGLFLVPEPGILPLLAGAMMLMVTTVTRARKSRG